MYQDLINKCEKAFEAEYLALIDLLNSEKFFSGDFDLDGYETTTNEKMALNLYNAQYSQPKKGIYIGYPDMYTDVPFEVNTSNIDLFEEDEKAHDRLVREFNKYKERLDKYITRLCKEKNISFYVDMITTDFINFYSYKTLPEIYKGKQESLFLDKQLEVYAHGGFPYCWVGRYPEGNLLVYLPQKK